MGDGAEQFGAVAALLFVCVTLWALYGDEIRRRWWW